MPLVDALLPEFDQEMTRTRKVLERVPDDKRDWKPHPKSFSLAALATHVAGLPNWGSETLNHSELDVGGTPQPLFLAQRVAELKRLPSRKAAPAVNPML